MRCKSSENFSHKNLVNAKYLDNCLPYYKPWTSKVICKAFYCIFRLSSLQQTDTVMPHISVCMNCVLLFFLVNEPRKDGHIFDQSFSFISATNINLFIYEMSSIIWRLIMIS